MEISRILFLVFCSKGMSFHQIPWPAHPWGPLRVSPWESPSLGDCPYSPQSVWATILYWCSRSCRATSHKQRSEVSGAMYSWDRGQKSLCSSKKCDYYWKTLRSIRRCKLNYSFRYHLNIVVNPLNQIGHLNQMAMQAQHQRIVDPRLQGIRGVYTPPVSGVAPRGMGGSPLMNRTLTPGKQGMTRLYFSCSS